MGPNINKEFQNNIENIKCICENDGMFNVFETNLFSFPFQDALLGEIKCFCFTPNNFLKNHYLKKNKVSSKFLVVFFFSPVVIHSMSSASRSQKDCKIMVLQITTINKTSSSTPSNVHPSQTGTETCFMQSAFYCHVKRELKTAEQNKTTTTFKHAIGVKSFFALYLSNCLFLFHY